MTSWIYFNSKFETRALSKSTTVIISGIDDFLHCQIYKSSFSISVNTDQKQIQSICASIYLLS